MKDFKVYCKTEEEKQKVLQKMEEEGIKWCSGHLPTEWETISAPVGFTIRKNKLSILPCSEDNFESYDKNLALITPEEYTKEKEKIMRKSDLKTGHLVVLRNGEEYIVYLGVETNYQKGKIEDVLVNGSEYSWMSLSGYNDDLKNIIFKRHDIMKVYQLNHPYALQDIGYGKSERILLWERKEEPKIKEITASEAAELLKSQFSDFDEVKIVV